MNLPLVNLRAMEPEDLDLLYTIENNRELWNVGTTNVPYSRYALHNYIANSSSDIYVDRQVRLMIEDEEKSVIGIIDIVNFDPQHLRAEVGIVIQQAHRGKGYGQAAMKKIIAYAHLTLHLHQLYAFIATDNAHSVRLFENMRFAKGAILKDWLYDGEIYHDAVIMQFFL